MKEYEPKFSVGVTMPDEIYGYGENYDNKKDAYEAVCQHVRKRLDEVFRNRKFACVEIDRYEICISKAENEKENGK